MAISTGQLYDRVKREFGVQSSSQVFEEAFFSALLSVSTDMLTRSFLEWTAPVSQSEEIDLDSKYYNCVYSGVKFYVNNGAEWNVEQKGDLFGVYERELRRAQSMYLEDEEPDVYKE